MDGPIKFKPFQQIFIEQGHVNVYILNSKAKADCVEMWTNIAICFQGDVIRQKTALASFDCAVGWLGQNRLGNKFPTFI